MALFVASRLADVCPLASSAKALVARYKLSAVYGDTYLRHRRPMVASSLTGPILLDGAKSAAGYVALGVDAQVHLQQIADELIE